MVERVEELGAELEARRLCECETARHRKVQSLHSRPIDRVAARVPEREPRGRSEGGSVEPRGCCLRAGRKYGLSRNIGANRVFSQHRAGVSRVSEHGNRERKAGLNLIYRGDLPIFCDRLEQTRLLPARQVVYGAQRETVPDVTTRSLFRRKVIVVLRNGRLEHRRTEIRCITEIFRPSVIGQESEAARVAPAHVEVSGVIPALRGVLEQIDSADGEADSTIGAARCRRYINHIVRKNGVRHKADAGEGTPGSDGPGARRSIVDKVGALQVHSV